MAETVVLGLRLTEGIDGIAFQQRFGCSLEDAFRPVISRLLKQGSLLRTDGGYRLPTHILSVANQVMLQFIG